MAQVTYVSAGTIARISATGNLTANLPSSPTTGNILVCYVVIGSAGKTIATATGGWSQVTMNGAAVAGTSDALFIAPVGSSAPVFSFTTDANAVKICRMIEVSNSVTTNTGFVDATGGSTGATSTTVSHVALTATGTERLGVCFIYETATNAIPALTGMTGGTWVESATDSTGTSSNSSIDTASLTNGVALTGGTATITSATWFTRTIAIVPAGAVASTSNNLLLMGVG